MRRINKDDTNHFQQQTNNRRKVWNIQMTEKRHAISRGVSNVQALFKLDASNWWTDFTLNIPYTQFIVGWI